jgi:hypothetical protein
VFCMLLCSVIADYGLWLLSSRKDVHNVTQDRIVSLKKDLVSVVKVSSLFSSPRLPCVTSADPLPLAHSFFRRHTFQLPN